MMMGRRADRLKADDPFLPALLPSALADFRPWVGVEMDTTLPCLPRRDKRDDPRRAGVQACHMHTSTTNSHASISPATARRQLCCTLVYCVVLCCDVAAPASALPVFQRGGPLVRRSSFSRHTTSFPAQAPFPLLLSLPGVSSLIDRAGKCESPLPADELIQQWQAVGEKACQSGPAVPQLPPSSWPCLMQP